MKNTKEKLFEEMVRRYQRTIYTVCYMFSSDTEEINDLFQEILVRLWLGYDSFNNRSDAGTWIYRVALNTAININKKSHRHPAPVPLNADIDLFNPEDSSLDQVRQLHQLIHELDVMDRALVLLWLEGINYEEIATIIGVSVDNVGVKLHRIKKTLVEKSKSVHE
jgi:RNA polymerase sigma-70 factor (ECF subfamily)